MARKSDPYGSTIRFADKVAFVQLGTLGQTRSFAFDYRGGAECGEVKSIRSACATYSLMKESRANALQHLRAIQLRK